MQPHRVLLTSGEIEPSTVIGHPWLRMDASPRNAPFSSPADRQSPAVSIWRRVKKIVTLDTSTNVGKPSPKGVVTIGTMNMTAAKL